MGSNILVGDDSTKVGGFFHMGWGIMLGEGMELDFGWMFGGRVM